jgi:hypothetical protein
VHNKATKYGFEFGQAKVSRCWSHNGAVCVRVMSRKNGKFVDIQLTPGGNKMYVSNGQIEKKHLPDMLADY